MTERRQGRLWVYLQPWANLGYRSLFSHMLSSSKNDQFICDSQPSAQVQRENQAPSNDIRSNKMKSIRKSEMPDKKGFYFLEDCDGYVPAQTR